MIEQPQLLTVIDGAIKTYMALPNGRRQIIFFHFAGERLLLVRNPGPFSLTIEALVPAILCRIDTTSLDEIRKSHPEIDSSLWACSSKQICAASSNLLRLGCMTADARVASFVVEMNERIGDREKDRHVVHLPMGRQEVAEYLGLNTETVSRVFTKLKRSGVLSLPKPHTIIVRDSAKLAQIAGQG